MSSIYKITLLPGVTPFFSSKFPKIISNSFSRSVSNFSPDLNGNMSDAVSELLKKKNVFSRVLSKQKWQSIESVTAVSTWFNSVSWSTISLPSFKLTHWDLYDLDYTEVWDTDLIRTAYNAKEKLPVSDLYIMETARTKTQAVPEISFRCFFIMLLDIQNGTLENSNLIMQRPSVLNSFRNLTVAGERTSYKNAIISEFMKESHPVPEIDHPNPFLLLKIERDMLGRFSTLSEHNQEKLACTLLLNLSFLNLAYIQNPNALDRIKNFKSQFKGKRSC